MGRATSHLVRRAFLVVWLLIAAGCGISPQPLPPPEISTAQMTLETTSPGRVTLRGAPGAVIDAGAFRVTNLSTVEPLTEVTVLDDGSFTVELGGVLADVYRVQAREEAARSLVADVTGTGEAQPVAAAPVTTPCLVLTPPLEVVGSPVALGAPIQTLSFEARNDCAADVVLQGLQLRLGLTEFIPLVGGGQFPRTLAPSDSFVLEVGFKSMTAGEFEDVVFLVLDMAGGPRRAVTVRATTLP